MPEGFERLAFGVSMTLYFLVIGIVHGLCLAYIFKDVYDNRTPLGRMLIQGPCEIRIALLVIMMAVLLLPPVSLYTVAGWVQLHIRYGRRERG